MKKSEIKHILDSAPPPTPKPEPELVFTKIVDPETGLLHKSHLHPEQYDHVRHIAGNLYYAWLRGPRFGDVYVGEFRQPSTADTP